jgi:hypothetical protein
MRLPDFAGILIRILGDDETRRVLDELCKEAAGENLYIPRRPAPPEVGETDTVQSVAKRHRVSVRTAYRWLGAWRN